jgi:hypothetical protein
LDKSNSISGLFPEQANGHFEEFSFSDLAEPGSKPENSHKAHEDHEDYPKEQS